MKIGILDQSAAGWSAGASYTRLILKSIALAKTSEHEIYFLRRNASIRVPEGIRTVPIPEGINAGEFWEIRSKLGLDVLLPIRDGLLDFGDLSVAGWIPDLQHLRMPELFTADDLGSRADTMKCLMDRCFGLYFSSQSAQADFKEFYPEYLKPTYLAEFASTLWDMELSEAPEKTVTKYHLPSSFILVPNQFWKHKNHEILAPALAATQSDVEIVVCGLPSDYRDPENHHLSRFFQDAARLGVAQRIHFLGHLSYLEMLDLMRCAQSILQPSRFEGWSTSIEDAKALGKKLICSDIQVHREQIPDALGFFHVDKPTELAELMDKVGQQGGLGFDLASEQEALLDAKKRSAIFGDTLLAIAVASQPPDGLLKPDQSASPAQTGWRYKITERLPELWRYHYGVWRFRVVAFSIKFRNIFWHLTEKYLFELGVFYQYPPRVPKRETFPPAKLPDEKLPSIAMVTPSYQQAEFLKATITSVLNEGYPKLQYAVLDGGSTDGSAEVIQQFVGQLAYSVSQPDKGQVYAIHDGFEKVSGDIMAYLNSDDLLMPGCLRFVGEYFATHPEVDVVYGHRVIIDESGQECGRWTLPPHFPEGNLRSDFIPQETLFWRTEFYEKIGGIDRSFSFAMDWDLILRFEKAGARMVRLPFFMGCFRVHSQQKSSALLSSVGHAEIGRLRVRELGPDPQKWDLEKFANQLKLRGVISRFFEMPLRTHFWK